MTSSSSYFFMWTAKLLSATCWRSDDISKHSTGFVIGRFPIAQLFPHHTDLKEQMHLVFDSYDLSLFNGLVIFINNSQVYHIFVFLYIEVICSNRVYSKT